MKIKRILVIAPHPDDETLGAGGTIAKLSDQGHKVHVLTVSGRLPPIYKREDYEITVKVSKLAFKVLGVSNSNFLEIPATMINALPLQEGD